ncbi:MAG TPA: hypothetical protein VF181_03155 [Balneolaceae bacterium]
MKQKASPLVPMLIIGIGFSGKQRLLQKSFLFTNVKQAKNHQPQQLNFTIMNWFNLRDLENRLSDNNVSDKEGFYYLMASFILFSLISYGSSSDYYNNDTFLFAEVALVLLITVVGLNLTFKVNQKGDGKDYLKRFLSLYFVIGIRLFVFIMLLAIPVAIFAVVFLEETSGRLIEDYLYISLSTIVGVIFYYLMVSSFKKVASYN